MEEIINWLNSNEGIVSAILSIISLIFTCVAVIISVSTAKRQFKIDLFEKRYEIYSRFSELFHFVGMISTSSLTYKGKMMLLNSSFCDIGSEKFKLGVEINKLHEQLLTICTESDEYKKIIASKNEIVSNKFFLDYDTLLKDETLLEKSKLLFPKIPTYSINKFFKIYSDIVMSANFVDEESMDELFKQWEEIYKDLENEKYLEKMKNFISLNKC